MSNAIDTSKETPLTMGELAYAVKEKWRVERTPRTFKLWAEDGRKRRSDGELIQLEKIYIGGILHSSVEAYERFIGRLNGEET